MHLCLFSTYVRIQIAGRKRKSLGIGWMTLRTMGVPLQEQYESLGHSEFLKNSGTLRILGLTQNSLRSPGILGTLRSPAIFSKSGTLGNTGDLGIQLLHEPSLNRK